MRKRLLVLSDTHGSVSVLASVLSWAKGLAPDAAVFLGDGIADFEAAASIAGFSCHCHMVQGNNDFGFSHKEALTFDFAESRFFACHGHRYTHRSSLDALVAAARNNGATAALFGHTHVPYAGEADGILLVNPGSVSRPRSNIGATFASMACGEGEPIKAEFWGIDSAGFISAVSVGETDWI